jgi:CRP-like cAMP-binding protein
VLGRHVEGEAFGELALLRDMPRSASAIALTPASVRVIGRDALASEVGRLSPWVAAILRDVAERFVDRSERLVELLRE